MAWAKALRNGLGRMPRWITSGTASGFSPGARMQQVRVATTIGTVVGLAFAIFNLVTPGMLHLGLIELFAVVCLATPALFLSRNPRYVGTAETLLLLAAMVVFGALVVHGGIESTGLFWVYTTPFLAYFLKGQRLGTVYSVGFVVAAALYLFVIAPHVPFARDDTDVFNFHFLLALCYYTLVAAAFDAVRQYYDQQLRKAKDKAEAAYLAKSRFLAAASHDLRQPAHALGMFVGRLRQMPLDASTCEVVTGLEASARALQEMLDLFFDYSRLEAQLQAVQRKAFALGPLLEQLGFLYKELALQKGLNLKIRATQAWVHSDPVLLQRILLNLVGNALQYTPAGTVLVACRPSHSGTHLRIEVRDSGIGIDRRFHEKVFEEFFQVENPQRDRNRGLGLGLGLSMVNRSCQLLGHSLQLQSAPGAGTRFTLTVPLAPPQAAPPPKPDSHFADPGLVYGAGGADARLHGMQVWLIEDDALVRQALQGLLQSWGCTPTCADSAAHALHQALHLPRPDFVLSDFRLGGELNGIEAVLRLQAHYGAPIKACLMSGDTGEELRARARAANLVLLHKPVAPAKLRSLLARARQGPAPMLGPALDAPTRDEEATH